MPVSDARVRRVEDAAFGLTLVRLNREADALIVAKYPDARRPTAEQWRKVEVVARAARQDWGLFSRAFGARKARADAARAARKGEA